jgi:hypothetical protein
MAQQGASPGMAANPAAPAAMTGSPWEQNMMSRLGPSGTPEDIAMRQQLFAAQAKAGTGPQFQGSGRPEWQSVGATGAVSRIMPGAQDPRAYGSPLSQGAQIQRLGNTMGAGPTTTGPGAGQGNQAARQAGYSAYKPGALGAFSRANPAKVEQPRWMARK